MTDQGPVTPDGPRRPTQEELIEAEELATLATGDFAEILHTHATVGAKVHAILHGHPVAAPAVVLVLSILTFWGIVGNRFVDPLNLSLIVQQVMIIGTIGIAQTLVILTAGIDLSVGAIMVLSSVVMGRLAVISGVNPVLALLIGLAVGLGCGLINGLLITRIKLPPFITTLGTLNVFFALNLYYSRSETIRAQDIEATAPILQWMGTSFGAFGARITVGSIVMVVFIGIFAYAMRLTAWGKHIYATGDDIEAARLAGIRTDRVILSVYAVAGVLCAVAGWVLIGRIGGISPQAGQTSNLDSITAVVIGGTSLFGGRGAMTGTLLGALIVGIFRNGLSLAGVDALWELFAVGVLILVAVGIDQWIRRVTA